MLISHVAVEKLIRGLSPMDVALFDPLSSHSIKRDSFFSFFFFFLIGTGFK